jgi:hypothetical protein
MKKQAIIAAVILFCTNPLLAQTSLSELPKREYFNFWVGEWELQWESSDGTMEYGTNTIEKILDGMVIKENFEAITGEMKGYIGKSFTVFDSTTNSWYQTWVDNQGSYLDFVGTVENEDRIFLRHTEDKAGQPIIQRMVFYDITKDQFSWKWEKSIDDGQNWEILWKIAYRRHGK